MKNIWEYGKILAVFALIFLLSGCSKQPTSPQITQSNIVFLPVDTLIETNPYTSDGEGNHLFTNGIQLVSNGTLYIRCNAYLPETSFTYQIFINSDANNATGYHGYDYVCRGPGIDAYGMVVRHTVPPAPGPTGGWGAVSGPYRGLYERSRHWLRATVPLCSLGDNYIHTPIQMNFTTLDGSGSWVLMIP